MLILASEPPEPKRSGRLIRLSTTMLDAIVQHSSRAKCRDMDPLEFYPRGRITDAVAERLCAGCPIIDACLEYALRRERSLEEVFGIWGGTTAERRKAMIRKRREAVA